MKITLISAIDKNNAIGVDGDLLAYISSDLKHFKELTTGKCIVMGRKTFESLPNGALPNRTNIVLTRDMDFTPEKVILAHTIEDILESDVPEIFVIGGGEIYKQFIDLADTLEITHIYFTFGGTDTFFPEIKPTDWVIDKQSEVNIDTFRYQFITYNRRK